MRKTFALGFCLLLSLAVNAADYSSLDSVGVEKVGDKFFIIHQVDEKETLFGISRRYQVSVNEVVQTNPILSEGLKIGQRIRIPYTPKATTPTPAPATPKPAQPATTTPSAGSVIHTVAQGETMFSISKRYNVAVGDIISWNKLSGSDLAVGQKLEIRTNAASAKASATVPAAATTQPKPSQPLENRPSTPAPQNQNIEKPAAPTQVANNAQLPGDWITHTVAQGETLFSISQKYNSSVDDIRSWNGLGSNSISVGQKLKVGREANSNVPVVTATVPVIVNNEKSSATLSSSSSERVDPNASTAYKNIKETGLAEVIEGTANNKKYLVLHRDAPVGTIMRVRNEENDITIFARVVGKLPDTGDNNKLVIKLSKAAYDQLRAVNPRFPVEISY
ncbi:LysM peptidoglycan-binding domain-containing protein [Mariniradius sediminis]|uniref:LysM peptidoglycan-binding domain-containing protein n=1 Tax=Mariniradius sediminis TaxID=2909237 RepID=A0ABS9C009_9BACT|nr:LysM peptidoglycan-binding domain-containing protein [Mariniradius sediminis]MCF1753299.1 LysM peptidoglycan-binding domain-containing protein [Mariniradius sediminis]